jgi:arabinose-5-phosphate isomerase
MMSTELTVGEIMIKAQDITFVRESDQFRVALEALHRNRLGTVLVLDEAGRLWGIITDGDVRRAVLNTQVSLPMLFADPVRKHMTRGPSVATPTMTVRESLQLMNDRLIGVLPVVEGDGGCLGIIHMQHALRAYLTQTSSLGAQPRPTTG